MSKPHEVEKLSKKDMGNLSGGSTRRRIVREDGSFYYEDRPAPRIER